MWGKPLNITRSSVASAVSRGFQKAAETVASFDNSNRVMSERLESACADIINSDPDVQLGTQRAASKFGIEGDLFICPRFNDDTLMIDEYCLMWGVSGKKSIPVYKAGSADAVVDYLMSVCLARDEKTQLEFVSLFKVATQQ